MKQKLQKDINLDGRGTKVGIIISEFNFDIGADLLKETINELDALNIKDAFIMQVPGALEIPFAAQKIILKEEFDVIIALGIVIKGETDHYRHVTENCARVLTDLSVKYEIPIIQGVIGAPNKKIAKDRVFRGKEYARSAVKMVNLSNY